MKRAVYGVILASGLTTGLASAEGLSQSAQSELLLMVQQLQTEVRQLRGQLETQQHSIRKLERDQLERYRDVDRRLSALLLSQSDEGLAPAPDPVEPVAAPAPVEQPPVNTTAPTPQTTAQAPAAQVSDAEAYQSAFSLVQQRRFDEAVAAFESFIQTYPGSDNLANAHYWIGEVKLAQQKLAPALASFKTVVENYPEHRKRPDALYKLGVVQDRMGDSAGKARNFEQLLTQYPSSSAAALARNYQNR